ncbi:hypothetical protein GCM10025880_25700 [Methylorubrum aminovorans]|nr:hypothetical protein GCM10025880_25700 [Methylorubrum aminovorans]
MPTPTTRASLLGLALTTSLAGSLLASPARADFQSCLAGIQAQAAAAGVSAQTFRSATANIAYDDKVIELSQAQPEFKTPIWDYMSALVDEERVEDGRAAMRQHAQALANAEARYGVDRHTIAAVWGVESNFGKNLGKMPLVQSLATLACSNNRRRDFFRTELIATLKIIERGDIEASRLTGSWAGAFGQTQFMPTTYQRLAVDGDGDGRRDVVDSVADAVASTANFLRAAKWSNGQPWGYEVRLPRGFNVAAAGRKNKHPVGHWASLGVTRVDGRPLTGRDPPASWPPPASTARPSSSPETSTRSTPTTPPNPTDWPSPSSRTACAGAPASRPIGRPTTRRSRAPSAATSRVA